MKISSPGNLLVFSEDFLQIMHDQENGWLHLDWKAYQTDASVKQGCNAAIELLQEHGISKILNDNTNVLGIWTGAASWLAFNALPRARQAGLERFAHLYGPSRFSRISAEAALYLLGSQVDGIIKTFDDPDDAKTWLKA